jgi:LysR family transcriptional regulator, low CO2-responsive transcriptional regulator
MMTTSLRGVGVRRESAITLSALRTFAAIVDTGSFSRAAVALGVSQPSVSIQLTSLERACNVPLLHRRPRLELTDAGRDLLVRARLIISRLEEFEDSVKDLHALTRGRISVGLSGPHATMPLIASFVELHPGIALTARVGNTATLLEDIAQCRIDVATVAMVEPSAALSCTRIADLRLAACVRRDDPIARRRSVAPAELVSRRFLFREEGSVTRLVTESAFAGAGVLPGPGMQVTGREAMKEAIVAGLGIGTLFTHEVEGDERLAAIPIAGAPTNAGIYAVALEESLDIPVVGAFIAHLQSHGVTATPRRPRRS